MMDAERERRLALGKLAYEAFAEQRVAAGNGMPPWRAGPRGEGLPESEQLIWAHVAEAVAGAIPFVITDAVVEATMRPLPVPSSEREGVTFLLRAAATAAGFRVIEQ